MSLTVFDYLSIEFFFLTRNRFPIHCKVENKIMMNVQFRNYFKILLFNLLTNKIPKTGMTLH